MARILYLWQSDYPWDIRVEKTCLALTNAGHEVHIVARNRKRLPPREVLAEGVVHRLPNWPGWARRADDAAAVPAFFNPRWLRLIRRIVSEERIDLILARDLPLCPSAIWIGRRARVPVILDMAENYPAMIRAIWETGRGRGADHVVRNPRFVEWTERYSVANADEVIAVVEESADRLLRAGTPARKITVVSNTPPAARACSDAPRSDHRSADDKRAPNHADIVYMGNLEVIRGLIESIEAVATLRGEGHDVRLRIIGGGRDTDLIMARALALGLGPDAVEFLGYIPSHSDALAIVAAADIGLLPHQKCESWNTTIPNKLFDYMAAGIPVVSSDAAPCERILRETGAGEVFSSGDARALADAVARLMDPERRARYGSAGRTAVISRFNWERDATILLGVVDRVLARRASVEKPTTIRQPEREYSTSRQD